MFTPPSLIWFGGTIGALLTGVFANSDLISSHPASKVLIEEGRFALIFGQLEAVLVAYGLSAFGTVLKALILQNLGIITFQGVESNKQWLLWLDKNQGDIHECSKNKYG